ncbi:AI-2E family transporter [bacterium]|nr:AI-2E family transporter [bacterium]
MESPSPTPEHKPHFLGRGYLFALLALLAVVFLYMIRMFLIPILLAAVFAGLFHGFYRWLRGKLGGRAGLASILSCILLLLILLGPLYLIGNMIAGEAISLYEGSEQSVKQFMSKASDNPLAKFKDSRIGHFLLPLEIDWQKTLSDIGKASGRIVAQMINRTSRTTFQFVVNLFIVLFTMFYFFRDGESLVKRLRYLSPMQDEYEDAILERFISVSRATVRGSLLLGVIQGTLGGIILWAFSIPSWPLWAVVMVVLSIIPMVGAWLVLYPAAIYLLLIGNIWQGVVVALLTAVIVGNIDNLLRPRLVGRDAGMHDLMIFFSTVGGIAVFGVSGFIVGPVIAALLLTLLDIYGTEFRTQLESDGEAILSAMENEPDEEMRSDRDDSEEEPG